MIFVRRRIQPMPCALLQKCHVWTSLLPKRCPSALPASDQRHFSCHDRHRQYVRVQWQACHIDNSIANVMRRYGWLTGDLAICLHHAARHFRSHLSRGIANIDLPTSNIERSAIQRRRFGRCRSRHVLSPYRALYWARGVWAEIEPLLIMRPPRGDCAFISFIACWVQRNTPVRLAPTIEVQCSRVDSSMAMFGH